MSRGERQLFLALAFVIALTRLLAIAHGMFDWDEGAFANAVRDYDVTQHHPHPPGYPLFIAPAKLLHAMGMNEFRALQTVAVLSSMLLFPALFFFARELGLDFATSLTAATIFVFLPNVWVYGGTAFSDVPGTAFGLAACALLLRGRSDSRMFVLGAVVLGISAGIRPLNLLLAAAPALVATWSRIRARAYRAVALAMILGAAIVGASYIGAGLASDSWSGFVYAVKEQSRYVHTVDSWHNPGREPLPKAMRTFWLTPVSWRQGMRTLAALAAIGGLAAFVRHRQAALLTAATFVPIAIVSWLNLDIAATARYAIPYFPLHVLYAAIALRVLGRRPVVQILLGAVLTAIFIVWTWPVLQRMRTEDPPPAAALAWVRKNVDPQMPVYLHGSIGPQAQYLLPEPQRMFYERPEEISLLFGDTYIVDPAPSKEGINFVWPHDHAWHVFRRRSFEMSVRRVSTIVQYGAGWYDAEDGFRWMGRESHTTLPAFGGQGNLKIRCHVPLDLVVSPQVELVMNGEVVDRFVPDRSDIDRTWTIASRSDAPNDLVLRTSGVANRAAAGLDNDARDLGIRLDELTWTPLR